jgi:hypothetical protein
LAKASEPIRRGLAHFQARRENLRTPPPNPNDVVGELRRQEIRSFLASLPLEQRVSAARELAKDPDGASAILDAPAVLSGLPNEHFEQLKKEPHLCRIYSPARGRACRDKAGAATNGVVLL